jgi:cellulose synthase/poly-beta-1,6-N-acetylglucosamine synthase-like glycosyltransferase
VPQIVAMVAMALGMAVAVVLHPTALVVAANLIGAIFFFGVSTLRFVAAGLVRRAQPMLASRSGELPVYTLLVPLHGEAGMVRGLVDALNRIDWPRDRLDIKIILEASDPETIAVVRRTVGGAPYEIVVVPNGTPRTKPRALAYAMQFVRGEFITVYDAEDRPHPHQLREAYAAFREAGPDVACFQSSLVIDNAQAGWLAQLFAIEYAALFDGLLPALAAFGMPLPLGGTSNHFRRAALEHVGGWDPFNVTEDADLGVRLARFGYRAATLSLPTLEEAPTALGPWVRQRTRWFKGWMQTWLVHTRHPLRLARELGAGGLLGFMLIGTGMIVSSLIYPVYLGTLLAMLTNPLVLWGDGGLVASGVVGVNLFNLVAGYFAMIVLSGRALRLRGRGGEAGGLFLLPLYWFLMSLASYRAIFELAVRPHYWAKTPH